MWVKTYKNWVLINSINSTIAPQTVVHFIFCDPWGRQKLVIDSFPDNSSSHLNLLASLASTASLDLNSLTGADESSSLRLLHHQAGSKEGSLPHRYLGSRGLERSGHDGSGSCSSPCERHPEFDCSFRVI